ncbi:pilus assembly protein [Novosphingobium sp. 1949]|uniref:Pilus assembly protein n=1 Tax=Novosphingobium organovorum TaxID=2930092 RepID=A0ABT0B8P9_9SPHN|nr:TadE family protein [Novosphingobium organovorum]MCJ2181432.1 pilus assembly protein [Novosphingobium organovorum]
MTPRALPLFVLRRARRLARAQDGVSAVEFALIAPIMLITLFGLFDLAYNVYTAELLEGAIQQTARDSTIEGASSKAAALDARVSTMIHAVAPAATLTFTRKAYASFGDVGKPEDFTDLNGDGRCDAGEPFEDANGNGAWDEDQGKTGQGSARDAVLYTVRVTYPRPFPVTALFGFEDTYTMVSRTVLRNQPYDISETSPSIGNCP